MFCVVFGAFWRNFPLAIFSNRQPNFRSGEVLALPENSKIIRSFFRRRDLNMPQKYFLNHRLQGTDPWAFPQKLSETIDDRIASSAPLRSRRGLHKPYCNIRWECCNNIALPTNGTAMERVNRIHHHEAFLMICPIKDLHSSM